MNAIDSFVTATSGVRSPELFRRWAGVSMISALLSRRVWTQLLDGEDPVYGNTFIALVGPPGGGKTVAMKPALRLLKPYASNVALSPQRATAQGLVTRLSQVFPDSTMHDRSYALWLTELMTFLNEGDTGHLANLADLWDCHSDWTALIKKDIIDPEKGKGPETIFRPYLCLLGGITPAMVQQALSQAQGLGLASRTIFVFSEEKMRPDYFRKRSAEKLGGLEFDLDEILTMRGEITFHPAAQELFREWSEEGLAPKGVLTHQKMEDYVSRRDIHLAKVAMCVAAACHPKRLVLTSEDLNYAKELLLATEPGMAKVLGATGTNQFLAAEDAAIRQLRTLGRKTLFEFEVRRALHSSVHSHLIGLVVEELVANKRLIVSNGKAPGRQFTFGANA